MGKLPLVVKSISHLKDICKDDKLHDFYIMLNYGAISRKQMSYSAKTGKFYIFNAIDGSDQTLTEKQLMSKKHSNIGEAIKKFAFVCEDK